MNRNHVSALQGGTEKAVSDALAAFPVGSMQSRAAARLLLERRSSLSEDDADALAVYLGTIHLNGGACPDYLQMGATAVYQRGKQIYEMRVGEIVPAHEDEPLQRCTLASLEFERAFQREPKAGDILRSSDVKLSRSLATTAAEFGLFVQAWRRKLPDLDCPMKIEGERVFVRTTPAGADEFWRELIEHMPDVCWRRVEREALERSTDVRTRCAAVTFLGVVDGKHRCRPATESELKKLKGSERK